MSYPPPPPAGAGRYYPPPAPPASPSMSRHPRLRALALLVIAAALVSGVLGVQEANGGGDFVPAKPADPCAVRMVTSVSTGINGLGERVVLLGIDGAACRLHVTREALVLKLAEEKKHTAAEVNALRYGLLRAVRLMNADKTLPPLSDFTAEAVDQTSLPGIVKSVIKALPDSLINSVLHTDDVLNRTIEGLDLHTLLDNLTNPDELSGQLNTAVTQAVKAALIAKLKALACQHLPSVLSSLLCG